MVFKRVNKLKFLMLVIAGFAIGLSCLWHVLKRDPDVHLFIEQGFEYLFRSRFAGNFSGKFRAIQFLQPSITFQEVKVQSFEQDQWQWQANEFKLAFSWIDLIIYGKVALKVFVRNVKSHSQIRNKELLIFDHLKRFIFNQSPIPIGLKELQIKHGDVTIFSDKTARCFLQFHAHAAFFAQLFKLNFYVQDGVCFYKEKELANRLQGTLAVTLKNFQAPCVQACVQAEAMVTDLEENKKQCLIRGFWNDQKGQIIVNNKDKSLVFALYDIVGALSKRIDMRYQIRFPLEYVSKVAASGVSMPITGDFLLSGSSWYGPGGLGIDGACYLNSLAINNVVLEQVKSHFFFDQQRLYVHTALKNKHLDMHAIINIIDWMRQRGTVNILNEAPIELPLFSEWVIPAQGITIKGAVDNDEIKGDFSCLLYHKKIGRTSEISTDFMINNERLILKGAWGNDTFSIRFGLKPFFMIDKFEYFSNKTRGAWLIKNDESQAQSLRIEYDLLHKILTAVFGIRTPGKGVFDITLLPVDTMLMATVNLQDGHIILPGLVNVITGLFTVLKIDYFNKAVSCDDLLLTFDKGTVECKHASAIFNSSFGLEHVLFPCVMKNIFGNVEKSLFATLNGMLTFSYAPAVGAKLAGFVIVERSQLKKNIFSAQVHHDLIKPMCMERDCAFDISVETKEPLVIKSPLLETSANLSIALRGSAQNPHISGSVDLQAGVLRFPYRPLHITSGKIYFLPHQLHDPIIELTAKGKIRKYHILMHCDGSARAPRISFESAPMLTEEQIITLLLSGSEEGTLSLAMPSLALHQLQSMLFDSNDDSKAESYFKNILGPLRHIKFVPRFADQTARGGFRGLIEIDIADQLRALIQKNFSLTEDTKLEIEYYLSDDITIRGIRDERGDLGAEVEMRLKF